MARPIVGWSATILIMAPLAVLGLRSSFVQDVMTEMPSDVTSVKNLRWLATKFDTGALAPLTVVLTARPPLSTVIESPGLRVTPLLVRPELTVYVVMAFPCLVGRSSVALLRRSIWPG